MSIKGIRALLNLAKCSTLALRAMRQHPVDLVFGTGGYSSAPVMFAARKANVPHVIHEQNSVPGRTQLLAARTATRVCTVFFSSASYFPKDKTVRTGMPVRAIFREISTERNESVFVTGGSQGSARLNAVVGEIRTQTDGLKWVHVVGKGNRGSASSDRYQIHDFLDSEGMARAMASCMTCVCRSGAGTLSEIVATRSRGIFVPLPTSFGNHQYVNAKELADGHATILLEERDLTTATLLAAIERSRNYEVNEEVYSKWDCPRATQDIVDILELSVAK